MFGDFLKASSYCGVMKKPGWGAAGGYEADGALADSELLRGAVFITRLHSLKAKQVCAPRGD